MKRALITGITGQDGSYLAELLLSKGYEVHGVVRRSSSFNTGRIDHVFDQLHLHHGDMVDGGSLRRIVAEVRPDEVYHLAAQSHVRVSFDEPEYTADVVALGTLRMLEAVREHAPAARVYHASSSEMFGNSPPPQDENTPFQPCSPYAIAKVAAHGYAHLYRQQGLFVACGILFNHECVVAGTPIIVRYPDGSIDCAPIEDIIRDPGHVRHREVNFEVWDRDGFVRARLATTNWNGGRSDRRVHRVIARSGEVSATAEHVFVREDASESQCEHLREGDRLMTTHLPDPPLRTLVSKEWARLWGLMASDGSVALSEGKYAATFRNKNLSLIEVVRTLWCQLTGGYVSDNPGVSGFTGEKIDGVRLCAEQSLLKYMHDVLYTGAKEKRVPHIVLNADPDAWLAFLSGYNDGDGLRAGHGQREFKNFKSSSQTLAAGLWWMASRILKQKLTLNVDFVHRETARGGRMHAYYSINLGVEGGSERGKHLLKPSNEVKRVIPESYVGWLYDIETDSGTFHAGVGDIVIHNSPRRGETFVTRKITRAAARIKLGLQKELFLGNLDARRDWGYAGDYVEAMHSMLQHDRAEDFVIATGRAESVRHFATLAFLHLGMDWSDYVRIDPRYMRPSEVDHLLGDSGKARRTFGWRPCTRLEELVRKTVDHDLELARKEAR
jgi:GDPmannose 4,6-dehydratase